MFAFLGTKWGDPTIGTPSGTINWDADLSGLDTAPGATTSGLETSLDNAFDRWEQAASVNFSEGGSIDVNIISDSFSMDGDPFNNGAAATASWSSFNGVTQSGTITFNSDLDWAPTGFGGVDFYAVALHEIGHILGLAHPSEADIFPDEIMNPVVRTNELGDGDTEGIQTLYGTDAGDDPAPDPDPGGGDDSRGAGGDGGGGGGGAGIGLVAGLLALILGIFTGGAGAAVALAAAKVADEEDTEDEDTTDDPADTSLALHGTGCTCSACAFAGHNHVHDVVTLDDGTIVSSHVTFVDLPLVDFDIDSFDQGSMEEDVEEDFFIV